MTGAFNYNTRAKKSVSHANRGKKLESYIEQANAAYMARGQAIIVKQFPEITIQQQQKTPSGSLRITKGFLKAQGVADYIGIASGRTFAFDAKETGETARFDLYNVKDHQLAFLQNMKDQGAFSFLIVRFSKLDESYILTIEQLAEWKRKADQGGRKSIPHEFFLLECEPVKFGLCSPVDYLPVLRKHFLKTP